MKLSKQKMAKVKKPKRLKPISLYPLKPEQALSAFMRIDPERIKSAERRVRKKSSK
jgi:hypothetical protein